MRLLKASRPPTTAANRLASFLATLLIVILLTPRIVLSAELELRVLEGEGAIHTAGRHSYSGITVAVANESQKPVAGAEVVFRLPGEGPSGRFAGGQLIESNTTDARGQASVWGIKWGETPGVCRITVTAKKDGSTAGMSVLVRIVAGDKPAKTASFEMPVERAETAMQPPAAKSPDPPPTPAANPPPPPPPAPRTGIILSKTTEPLENISSGRSKWLILSLGIAGAIGGGLAYRYMRTQPGLAGVAEQTTPALTLGQPAITVGKP